MDREVLHQQILRLKGKICAGQLELQGYDEYLLMQLDKVKDSEDGLVDVSTVSSTLRLFIDATEKLQHPSA
ncbi:hypothetical protein SAMN05192559_11284 [Halobacillus karajensis]|uniref:Uncharacterized protein n=1 Tax=Halobacillus karajensis TaxID=195088 RepID=A0A024P9I9_9BACI|nr:hypothetical protein [Halobacillus karajensis]CDQ21320.1 hypothetical protein BN982_03687 [Halobacillus karajensis]CDQ25610.1 hypothetical protein BN983_03966 [Halobacillus karajensis]CDQ25881.1 hypothetical protein BN981_00087 [Halobacillus karajensis]SEI10637.1 hypothetical protein SAMN05192559_11284 [Halobacillus karajensis]